MTGCEGQRQNDADHREIGRIQTNDPPQEKTSVEADFIVRAVERPWHDEAGNHEEDFDAGPAMGEQNVMTVQMETRNRECCDSAQAVDCTQTMSQIAG